MSFSQSCGTAVVPLLARLVLGVTFVAAGYNKVTVDAEFGPDDAAVLQHLGVDVKDDQGVSVAADLSRQVRFAAWRQEDEGAITALPAPVLQEETTDDSRVIEVPEVIQADDAATAVEAAIPIPPLPDGTYTARGLHRITLLCHDAGWPQPSAMAWAAALTELVGGGLVLVGFLSRIWGLGLAGAMGSAFYLVSMGKLGVHTANPLVFAQEIPNFTTVAAQLALFVLALGVLLTGAGPLSVDHMLFRRSGRKKASSGVVSYEPAPQYQQPAPPYQQSAPQYEAPAPHIPSVPESEEPIAPPRPSAGDDAPARRPL